MNKNINFEALFEFNRQIQNDLASNNKKITIAVANVKYYWHNQKAEVVTKIHIALDAQPHSRLAIEDNDWLNADDFYVEFLTGYNHFSFDEDKAMLIIKCETPSKLGPNYKVEITEAI